MGPVVVPVASLEFPLATIGRLEFVQVVTFVMRPKCFDLVIVGFKGNQKFIKLQGERVTNVNRFGQFFVFR